MSREMGIASIAYDEARVERRIRKEKAHNRRDDYLNVIVDFCASHVCVV